MHKAAAFASAEFPTCSVRFFFFAFWYFLEAGSYSLVGGLGGADHALACMPLKELDVGMAKTVNITFYMYI